MTDADIEKQRRKLTRTYDLTAMFREYGLGYKSKGRLKTFFFYLRSFVEVQFLSHYFGLPPKWRMYIRRFGGKRTLPDFYVIGPYKSGSSDLTVSLSLHPAIMPPLVKELMNPWPESWRKYYPTEKEKSKHAKKYGSALTPFFGPFLNVNGMERTYWLSKVKPEAKIILILREPAVRVYSHWKWEYLLAGQHTATELPFLRDFPSYVDRALSVFPENLMYTAFASQGLHTSIYVSAVRYWIECFGREQVMILNMGEYWQDRSKTLHKIHDFLDIRRFDVPEISGKANSNPLTKLPPADDASMAKLRAFFAPYNEELWEVIGERFDW